MLGNFSIGDYFKQGAVEFAWELSLKGFGFDPERDLGHGLRGRRRARPRPRRGGDRGVAVGRRAARADRPAARARRTSGRPGPTGPCGPCSELYLDRGLEFGARRRAARRRRASASWSTGTSSSCSTTRTRSASLAPLPAQNIDTGLGLNRLAAIMQGTTSVFETDQIRPLITLGEELSGSTLRRDRGRRPRAADPRRPHARHVVPDRRRRRALQRGPRLRAAPADAPRDRAGPADRHRGRLPAALRRRRARD